jgi:sulfur carrier protein
MGTPPLTINFNGQPLDVPDGTTVAQLLELAAIRSKLVAVEINLEILSHEEHATYPVRAGDKIEVVTLVGGG